jgi:transmembrane sensor
MPSRKELMHEAAEWYAALDAGVADIDAFERWRDADPRHAVAFARIIGAVSLVDKLKPDSETGER